MTPSSLTTCLQFLPLDHPSVFFFFFFSSRRRHTRYIGDWSSDVCSSDLQPALAALTTEEGRERWLEDEPSREIHVELARSEERRVGKECRGRGWAEW